MTNTTVIQNITNIGTQSGCGNQQAVCGGYTLYVPCITNLAKGNDATISFYLLDPDGYPLNTDDVQGIIVEIENQYGCSEAYGIYNNVENYITDDSDSDALPRVEIRSMQQEQGGVVFSDSFTDLTNDGKPFVDSRYKFIDGCYNGDGCVKVGSRCDGNANYGETGVMSICISGDDVDAHGAEFNIVLGVRQGTTKPSSECCVSVNGKRYTKPIPTSGESDSDSDDITLLDEPFKQISFNVASISGDNYIDIRSSKTKGYNYAIMDIKSISISAIDCIVDEGLFVMDLPSDVTAYIVRGNLKMVATVISADGTIHTTNCAIFANVR